MITRILDASEVRQLGAELLVLQHAAYEVEASLIRDNRIPPLHETERDLVAADLVWMATLDGDRIAGAIAYSVDGGVVDIDRLMIDPDYHRQGLGAALVNRVATSARSATVATGRENAPARALYEKLGFTHSADFEPIPGLWVSEYSRARPMSATETPASAKKNS